MKRARLHERGLSLIEAIVVVTITSTLALILLPLSPRMGARALDVAERDAATLEAANAERDFRALVRAVSPRVLGESAERPIRGDAQAVLLSPNLAAQTACGRAGAPTIRLAIRDDALVCESDAARVTLLRWSDGGENAAFAYSGDGVSWRATWSGPNAPMLRFTLRGAAPLTWIERPGGAADAT